VRLVSPELLLISAQLLCRPFFAVDRRLPQPDMDEADLTALVHYLVNNDTLCNFALKGMRIHDIFALTSTQPRWKSWPWTFGCPLESRADGKRRFFCDAQDGGILAYFTGKVLADIVEALIGVFYIYGGTTAATAFLDRYGVLDQARDTRPEPAVDRPLRVPGHALSWTSTDPRELSAQVQQVERLLSYSFTNRALLVAALTHPSYAHRGAATTYQRLEFLGDAAIGLPVTRVFFDKYESASPGELTALKGEGLSNIFFARVVVAVGLHRFLWHDCLTLSDDMAAFEKALEAEASGTSPDAVDAVAPNKALGDVLESVAGAVLVDKGGDVDAMWEVMGPLVRPHLDRHASLEVMTAAPESTLKRITREAHHVEPAFVFKEVAAAAGTNKGSYVCTVTVRGKPIASCPGRNRRHARRCACEVALNITRGGVQPIPPRPPSPPARSRRGGAAAGGGAAAAAAIAIAGAAESGPGNKRLLLPRRSTAAGTDDCDGAAAAAAAAEAGVGGRPGKRVRANGGAGGRPPSPTSAAERAALRREFEANERVLDMAGRGLGKGGGGRVQNDPRRRPDGGGDGVGLHGNGRDGRGGGAAAGGRERGELWKRGPAAAAAAGRSSLDDLRQVKRRRSS